MTIITFAHLADCHIGSWRDPKLKECSTNAFLKAMDKCIAEQVDFMVIAGDLFNTSLPAIDSLKASVKKLKEVKDRGISVYGIPGSHDYSPSGKTMLDVLEQAGLFCNVVKGKVTPSGKLQLLFTVDQKTGIKITGLLGKRGMLERSYYEQLDHAHLEAETGLKIFCFHTAFEELKPKELQHVETSPLSLLPKGFLYYAGGHVHVVFTREEEGYGKIAYPGPLFPNSFKELEDLKQGGFYLCTYDTETRALVQQWEPVQVYNVYSIIVDATMKTPQEIEDEIMRDITTKEFNNTIVTIRVEGTVRSGKPSEIRFKDIYAMLYDRSAYYVMKNTTRLQAKEFSEINVQTTTTEETERALIKEHLGQQAVGLDPTAEEQLTLMLMKAFDQEKNEGETNVDFEQRILGEGSKTFQAHTNTNESLK
ncbi:exonuclease SbcCD subunit D [Candidatus Woesearchaeota archaeon]|nr:exonuclease SbcCD subunit D [Candidatus Woesearchaeota archaeon]